MSVAYVTQCNSGILFDERIWQEIINKKYNDEKFIIVIKFDAVGSRV